MKKYNKKFEWVFILQVTKERMQHDGPKKSAEAGLQFYLASLGNPYIVRK